MTRKTINTAALLMPLISLIVIGALLMIYG